MLDLAPPCVRYTIMYKSIILTNITMDFTSAEYHAGLVDLVTYYKWDKVIYIYSDFDGFLRLQRIYQSIPRWIISIT